MLFFRFVTKGANVINFKTKAKNLRSQVSRIFEGKQKKAGIKVESASDVGQSSHCSEMLAGTACFEGKGAAQAKCVSSAKVLELCTLS